MYRVRAYTRWMLNEGETSFFNQVIPVGSIRHSSREPVMPINNLRSGKPDIQFFPEGGELLTGVETKVAFKAIANNGLGIKVKGIIIDNDGKEITRFQSAHLGMGFFYLKPEEGKSYSAKLNFGDGSGNTVNLPKANRNGIVLSADNDSPDSAIIHVLSAPEYFKAHQNEDITLLIYAGGTGLMAKAKLDSGYLDFAIDKRPLHSGLMRVTLFSSHAEPLSERLLFIKKQDQINLEVKSTKPQYAKREKVEVFLNASAQDKSPVMGDFSVSVVNEDFIKSDENKESTIVSSLLLSSELNGYVEQPNYYFIHSGDEVTANLDILMMTQGYRHFLWKQILTDSLPPLSYKAERFLQLQGFVRSVSGKLVKNETVTLSDPAGQGPVLEEKTDSAGRFVFGNLDFSNVVRFNITAGKISSRIFLNSSPVPLVNSDSTTQISTYADSNMNVYLKNETIDQEFKNSKNVKVLKEVTVIRKKSENADPLNLTGTGHADQVLQGNVLNAGGSLSDQLTGRLRGVLFLNGEPRLSLNFGRSGKNIYSPMVLFIDGMEVNASNINDLTASQIETIEIFRPGSGNLYNMSDTVGVLVITTKRPKEIEVENVLDSNSLQVSVTGFYKAKEFYSPAYAVSDTMNEGKDRRVTVFWKPDLITDKNGDVSFSFYNSDLNGTYKVVVEGIIADGEIGRQVYRYTVK